MKLQLHNSWKLVEDDRWDWSAYLTGPDLSKVKSVEYILHPTFKNPVRIISEPKNGFLLQTAGWGTFELKALVHLEGGGSTLLTHELKLEESPNTGRTDK